MKYKYLSEQDIIEMNQYILKQFNLPYNGIQYPQGLSLVIEQPQMILFGHELYPNLWIKAAYIMQKITKKHIFFDGNKRTSFMACSIFLEINNFELSMNTDESESLLLQLTISDDTEEEMLKVAGVLKKYSIPLD